MPPSPLSRSRRLLPFLIGAVVVVINFIAMPAQQYQGDAESVRMETINLLTTGHWGVPEAVALPFGPPGNYFFRKSAGEWYPKYGVFNTLMYAPALALEKLATGSLGFETDHTLWLNLLNLVFAGASAAYLTLLALRLTSSKAAVCIFVFASIYGTFWWNYLRTQTFESYLPLLVIALFYHLACAKEQFSRFHLLLAGGFLGLLCLCKTVFVLFLPAVIVLLLIWRLKSVSRWMAFFGPVLVAFALLLCANACRFGSPLETGYTQWASERVLFSWAVGPAIRGFFSEPGSNLFLHYPVFLLALPAWPCFFRRYRFEALLAFALGAVVFAFSAARPEWRGGSCYGPRYLLPVLPLLSLPFLDVLDWLGKLSRICLRWLLAAVAALILGWSALLQTAVNTLPFYFWFDLAEIARDDDSPALDYLKAHQFGTVNIEFLAYAQGRPSPFSSDFVELLEPAGFGRLEALKMETRLNYYWFRYSVEPGP